jgi:hypothetical protein
MKAIGKHGDAVYSFIGLPIMPNKKFLPNEAL